MMVAKYTREGGIYMCRLHLKMYKKEECNEKIVHDPLFIQVLFV